MPELVIAKSFLVSVYHRPLAVEDLVNIGGFFEEGADRSLRGGVFTTKNFPPPKQGHPDVVVDLLKFITKPLKLTEEERTSFQNFGLELCSKVGITKPTSIFSAIKESGYRFANIYEILSLCNEYHMPERDKQIMIYGSAVSLWPHEAREKDSTFFVVSSTGKWIKKSPKPQKKPYVPVIRRWDHRRFISLEEFDAGCFDSPYFAAVRKLKTKLFPRA